MYAAALELAEHLFDARQQGHTAAPQGTLLGLHAARLDVSPPLGRQIGEDTVEALIDGQTHHAHPLRGRG